MGNSGVRQTLFGTVVLSCPVFELGQVTVSLRFKTLICKMGTIICILEQCFEDLMR